jgi:glycosyltransferase involved in cell wall biosynthesis
MSAMPSSSLTSIIVPCCNQREFTQLGLQALFRFTRPAWELIVIDNGSTDGTGPYLEGVRDAAAVPVTVIANGQNLGFPRAVNQGLRAARGEYLVLLNNDAVVTDGWLDQLIALSSIRMEATEGAGHEDGGRRFTTEHSEYTEGRDAEGSGASIEQGPSKDRGRSDGEAIIGLVGPMTNYATPPQLVADVPYRDLDAMHAFARRWRDEHRGRWFTAAKLSGFCVLIKRAVYEAIGGLDERFGLGLFDDDDLAVRARRAGFGLAVAHDLFIHHFGSRTFAGNGIDASRLLEENARRFAAKWGPDVPAGRRVALRPWDEQAHDASQGSHAESGGKTPIFADSAAPPMRRQDKPIRRARTSLTIIARDEAENLPHCLGSVRGIFDEIVVVDTGSVDRTREIAREHGAKVYEFAWIDDFAAARNAALDHATGDYAFWLDADDVIEPGEREKLVALLEGLGPPDPVARASCPWPPPTQAGSPCHDGAGTEPRPPEEGRPAAYVVRCACDPGADGSGGETVVDHIRLFPLRPDVRWTYRVHEQILPALRRAGIPVRWTGLTVRHTGYADVALRARKLERDTRILLDELKDRPDEPFILFNLGAIAIERKDWHGALGFLRRSLQYSAPSDSITRKLFALIARAHQMLDDTGAALRVCAEGLSLDPEDAELWFRKAVVHRQQGESAEAEACWRRILELTRPERFASVDMGIYGHLTRRNLAVLAAERGDKQEEERLWRAVLAECPGDREALARLERLASVLEGTRALTPPRPRMTPARKTLT